MGRSKSKHRTPKISSKIPAPEAVSSSPASVPPPPPRWIELPRDVTANILQRLGAVEILESAQKVCTTWRKICRDPAMWRVVYLRNRDRFEPVYNIMCRCAVDRSQGQLVDLSVEYLDDKETMTFIADRASNLKRLTLRDCYCINGVYLGRVVKKLPELEELHLKDVLWVYAEGVRDIGLSCPNLKSFSFDGRISMGPHQIIVLCDELEEYDYALAISKTMPNLRHLQLFGKHIHDERLESILDGCPHLESLDLSQCYDLNIGGDLARRCREQIKDLRLPLNSVSDTQQLVHGD